MLNEEERRLYLHQCVGGGRTRPGVSADPDSSSVPAAAGATTAAGSSRTTLAALKVTRKYRQAVVRRREYRKLKAIVPAVSDKHTVSKLTIIEEAIKYIDKLHSTLMSRLHDTADADVLVQPASLSCGSGCHANPDAFIRQLCFDSYRARHPAAAAASASCDDDDVISAGSGSANGEVESGPERRHDVTEPQRLALADRRLRNISNQSRDPPVYDVTVD